MVTLASLSYFADRGNDQRLRTDLLIEIAVLAQRDQLAPPVLRAQIHRCALAEMASAAVERDDAPRLRAMIKLLAPQYQQTAIGPAAEDLPLIHGLRALALLPDPEAVPILVGATIGRADMLGSIQPLRASRLLGEAARVLIAAGDRGRAWALVQRLGRLRGDPKRAPRLAWQNFPGTVRRSQGRARSGGR